MTKPPRKPRSSTSSSFDLDSWLFSPELDPALLTLLGAYRDAAEGLREAMQASKPSPEAVPDDLVEPLADDTPPSEKQVSRGLPAVPRLHAVPGLEESDLAHLHGQLVANGFATVEILGRTDGLAYRITRDGLRQLDGEIVTAEAA